MCASRSICVLGVLIPLVAVCPAHGFFTIIEPTTDAQQAPVTTIPCRGTGLENTTVHVYQFKKNAQDVYESFGWTKETPTSETSVVQVDGDGFWTTTAYFDPQQPYPLPNITSYPLAWYKIKLFYNSDEFDDVQFQVFESE